MVKADGSSNPQLIYDVLSEADRPLLVNEIAERAGIKRTIVQSTLGKPDHRSTFSSQPGGPNRAKLWSVREGVGRPAFSGKYRRRIPLAKQQPTAGENDHSGERTAPAPATEEVRRPDGIAGSRLPRIERRPDGGLPPVFNCEGIRVRLVQVFEGEWTCKKCGTVVESGRACARCSNGAAGKGKADLIPTLDYLVEGEYRIVGRYRG